ncbi:MAG: flagellar protein FlbB [Spirochaetales bacterium]|nr:flagellar protein FlbB [Spirochaetales bacterium]
MARFKAVRSGSTIVLLILLILALGLGGVIWFDYLGFLDARKLVSPVLSLLNINQPEPLENADAPGFLDQERIKMQQEELALRMEELDNRENNIRNEESELTQMREALEERENALADKEKSFNDRLKQYDNRNANLRQTSQYFVGMAPDAAVKRLEVMDDQDIIDIMRMTEAIAQEEGAASMVSYWLSLMEPDKAANLSRKMLKKPED